MTGRRPLPTVDGMTPSRTVLAARLAMAGAVTSLVLVPLHGLARFNTDFGHKDLDECCAAWWGRPGLEALHPLITWSDPYSVYLWYGRVWVLLLAAAAFCGVRRPRGPPAGQPDPDLGVASRPHRTGARDGRNRWSLFHTVARPVLPRRRRSGGRPGVDRRDSARHLVAAPWAAPMVHRRRSHDRHPQRDCPQHLCLCRWRGRAGAVRLGGRRACCSPGGHCFKPNSDVGRQFRGATPGRDDQRTARRGRGPGRARSLGRRPDLGSAASESAIGTLVERPPGT